MLRIIPIVCAETLIPRGPYCYERLEPRLSEGSPINAMPVLATVNPCPFWSLNEAQIQRDRGSIQRAGYCSYLKAGDWQEEGTFLLWDQVKECGVRDEEE